MVKRSLAVGMVGAALTSHLMPLARAWAVYPLIGGDDMTKPLGQLLVILFTAQFVLLAVVDPVCGYVLYRTRRRLGKAADEALLLAATAAALPPVLLMGLVFVILVGGRLLARAQGSP